MPAPRLFAIALTALVSTIGGEAAFTAEPTSDPTKAVPAGANSAAMQEIEFFLARGEADACGPGCNEWIAAEGKIDAGAAQRLRRLLAKLGRRRLPIYFHSPGGSVAGSLDLGQLIHDQKLEVSVAHTVPLGCDRDKPLEKSCEALKHSGQELDSEFDQTIAMCNSGCVYAVAGGNVRLIPPGVKLGIHDVGLDPEKAQPRGALAGEGKRIAHARIQEYLRDVGIDAALFKAASAIPFESKKFLEREELVRFGIDRREFGESGWQFADRPTAAMRKRFFVRTEGDQVRYLDGFMSMECGAGQAVRLVLGRQHGVSETPGSGPRFVAISMNGQRFDLPFQFTAAEADMRWASLAAGSFDAVGDDATIALLGTGLARHDEPAGSVKLNVRGFSTAYAKLRKSCDGPVRNTIAAVLPGMPVPYLDPGSLRTLSAPAAWGLTGAGKAPAAPAAEPGTPRSTPNAADLSAQSEPAQEGCRLNIANEPKHVTGRVTGFLTDQEALERTRRVEAQLGARISPAYLSLERVTVERDPQNGAGSTMAAIPEHMVVEVGDRVELNSRYRDQSLRCNFIPWTVNRLVEHVD